jgi:hypothetical protein
MRSLQLQGGFVDGNKVLRAVADVLKGFGEQEQAAQDQATKGPDGQGQDERVHRARPDPEREAEVAWLVEVLGS